MEVSFVTKDAHLCELRMDNLTVAELMRVYLNDAGVSFVAWRREHPTKPIVFRVESKDKPVKKIIAEAISSVTKDLDSLTKSISK